MLNIIPTNTAVPNTPNNSAPPVPPPRKRIAVPASTNTPATPGTPTPPDLVQLHASSSTASPYPDAKHQEKEQKKNRIASAEIKQKAKQNIRKEESSSSDVQGDIASPKKSPTEKLKELNAKIRRTERNLHRAQNDDRQEKRAKKLAKGLRELKQEKAKLEKQIKKIAANTDQSDSVSSNERSSDSEIAPGSNTKDQSDAPDALETIQNMLDDGEQAMEALSKEIRGLINSPGNQDKIKELMNQTAEIQGDINSLKILLKHYGADGAPQPVAKPEGSSSTARPTLQHPGVSKPEKSLPLLELIRTKTSRRPEPAIISPKPVSENGGKARFDDSSEVVGDASSEVVGENSSDGNSKDSDSFSSVMHSVHENARNSTLIMPEDLKLRLSLQARKTVDKIDFGIEKAAIEGDQMGLLVASIKAQLNRMREDGHSTASEIAEKEKMLVEHKKKQRKFFIKVGKLIEARDKLEEKELPEIPRPTQKEKDEAYKVLLESVKSIQTRGLEKIHTDMLAELERTTGASLFSTSAYTLLAGASAFSVSFLIANTLSRFVPRPLIAISWVGAPSVAGTLHVITATPMAKQVMQRAWTSNAMGELNNHFKLRGSALRDWWRGESNEPKYASKDTTKTDKISITERLKEEKPFSSLFYDRYMTEELGYYSYSMNYTFKAIAAAGISHFLAGGSWASKGAEAAMHGLLGAFSGAEYLLAQQEQRSKHPNAKQSALPTRECFAAEAAALQSLRDDLQAKITAYRNQLNKDPKDKTESNLNKALRKTDKALIAATLRSGVLGTLRYEFWAQFSPEAIRDTLSEVLGRILSLVPTALVSELTKSWRASPDPLLMFLGHALPAVVLIAPPGFTARPFYSGVIRALLKAFETDTENKTVVTRAPDLKSIGEDDSEVETISSSASQRSSKENASESVIVDQPSEADDSDEEKWEGNPTERDLHQGL